MAITVLEQEVRRTTGVGPLVARDQSSIDCWSCLRQAGRHGWMWGVAVVVKAGMRLGAAMAKAAGHGIAGGVGVAAGIALLLPMEAGVPIPVPADLLMLAIGARVSAGDVPLPVAALAFEVIAILGTTALFLAARGPGYGLARKFGPRLGLTSRRLERATGIIDRRGRPALAVGRALPGLRTVTVIAAGTAGLPARRALPALVAGSTFFSSTRTLARARQHSPARTRRHRARRQLTDPSA